MDSSTRQLPLSSTMSQVALPFNNTMTSPGTKRREETALQNISRTFLSCATDATEAAVLRACAAHSWHRRQVMAQTACHVSSSPTSCPAPKSSCTQSCCPSEADLSLPTCQHMMQCTSTRLKGHQQPFLQAMGDGEVTLQVFHAARE